MTDSSAPASAPLTDLLRAQWATENGPFRSRVQMGLTRQAVQIVAQGGEPSARRDAALDILRNPSGSPHVWPMLCIAASDTTISGTVQDKGGAVFASDDVVMAALEKAWDLLHPGAGA